MWKTILVGLQLLNQHAGMAEQVVASPSEQQAVVLQTWGRDNPSAEPTRRTWKQQPWLLNHDQRLWLGIIDEAGSFQCHQFVAWVNEQGVYKPAFKGAKIQKLDDGSIRLSSSVGWIYFAPTTESLKIFRPVVRATSIP